MKATRAKFKRCSALKVSLCGWAVNPIYSSECDRCPLCLDRPVQSKQTLEPKIEEKTKEIDRFDLVEIDSLNEATYMRKLRLTLRRLKR